MRLEKIRVWLFCLPFGMSAIAALAQNYPAKPIHIIAQFTPGTSTDILARLVAQKMSES